MKAARVLFWLTMAATAVASFGCGPKAPPKGAFTEAPDLLKSMAERRSSIRTVRITGRVDHFGKAHRVQGKVYIFAQLPDRLRMELVSPFGSPLTVLTVSDGQFALNDIRKGTFTDVKRSPYIDGPEITSAMVSTLAHLPYSWSASSDEGLEITADTRKLSPQIREILGKLLAIAKGRNPRLTCEFEFPLGTKLLIGGGVLATAIVGGILIKRHMDA